MEKCIQNDILAGILRKNRGEIGDSILTEWNEDEYRDYLKEEGIKIGEKRGKIVGKIEACQDFRLSKEETLMKIIKDFQLDKEEAEKYMKEYWKCD